ncbi:MAG: 4-hydroxy-tetrahydrodipicolinate reductase [Deltaproteobacteria bacterium]|nr:4-hydroxy-tetrahydrodipicolinate reductase [Deltaproteobacteria bacterium]
MLQVAVTGASGRMAGVFIEFIAGIEDVRGYAVTASSPADPAASTAMAERLAGLDLVWQQHQFDVIVDFSFPEATLAYAVWAAARKVPMVIGTTGFTLAQLDQLADTLQSVPVLLSPNMSLMMNLAWRMTANATTVLPKEMVDVEIVEKHHRDKRNAPSSTALKLAQIVAEKRGWSLAEALRHNARWGMIGSRPEKEIAIASVRGGSLISEHSIIFAGSGESLEITHRSQSLSPFARGSLRAARWIVKQNPGVYDMLDLLGLAEVLY